MMLSYVCLIQPESCKVVKYKHFYEKSEEQNIFETGFLQNKQ